MPFGEFSFVLATVLLPNEEKRLAMLTTEQETEVRLRAQIWAIYLSV